jgi:ribosomal protein S18 acetylase RimI-like enzyme
LEIRIRSIAANELEAFAMMTYNQDKGCQFKQALVDMWRDNESYPEWCFVVEQNERFIARVAYWAFASSPNEINMTGLHVPWNGAYLSIGRDLLLESLRQMQAKGATNLGACLYSDSTTFLKKRIALLRQVGLRLMQEKQRYILKEIEAPAIIPDRLIFRTLAEVDEKTFIDSIKQVTMGTLDKVDCLALKSLGAEKIALKYFNTLKNIDYNLSWWLLAYKSNGKLVGLVVSQKFSNEKGAINYIGVVPDQRGQGYVHDILAKGTSILKADGVKHILADVDSSNIPLINALCHAGYKKMRTMWVYNMKLNVRIQQM